jgi:hypothetical protein
VVLSAGAVPRGNPSSEAARVLLSDDFGATVVVVVVVVETTVVDVGGPVEVQDQLRPAARIASIAGKKGIPVTCGAIAPLG